MEQKSVTLKIRPGITAVLCADGGTYLIFDEPIQLVNFTAMEVARMEDVRLRLMEEAQEELQAAFDAWAAPFLPPVGATRMEPETDLLERTNNPTLDALLNENDEPDFGTVD